MDPFSDGEYGNSQPGLIPFGKYRGKPIDVLLGDGAYTEWLRGQAWVAERFPQLHTIIINNFGDAGETPEHNAFQLRFLDEGLCRQMCRAWMTFRRDDLQSFQDIVQVGFEMRGNDVGIAYTVWEWAGDRWFDDRKMITLELKPSLGDDYPASLRKMLAPHGAHVLCYDRWVSQMPIGQVRQLFAKSGALLCAFTDLAPFPSVPNLEPPMPVTQKES